MKIPGGGRGPGAEPSVLCAVRHVHDTATEYSHAARAVRACGCGGRNPNRAYHRATSTCSVY